MSQTRKTVLDISCQSKLKLRRKWRKKSYTSLLGIQVLSRSLFPLFKLDELLTRLTNHDKSYLCSNCSLKSPSMSPLTCFSLWPFSIRIPSRKEASNATKWASRASSSSSRMAFWRCKICWKLNPSSFLLSSSLSSWKQMETLLVQCYCFISCSVLSSGLVRLLSL